VRVVLLHKVRRKRNKKESRGISFLITRNMGKNSKRNPYEAQKRKRPQGCSKKGKIDISKIQGFIKGRGLLAKQRKDSHQRKKGQEGTDAGMGFQEEEPGSNRMTKRAKSVKGLGGGD